MNLINNNKNEKDTLTRFLFEDHLIRGEIVRLNKTFESVTKNHNYPEPIKKLLGEMLVITSLLTATLKFKGKITFQIQSEGALNLAVVNGNNNLQMRAYAKLNTSIDDNATLSEMVKKGFIVITVSPAHGERYQSVVEISDNSLSKCIENYFKQSEQLPTRILIKIGEYNNQLVATGILLQVLPDSKNSGESFEHLMALTETITKDELFSLPTQEILYRLYHQEYVRLFESKKVSFSCACSKDRCEATLKTLPPNEIEEIITQDNQIDMHCDYCGNHYIFNKNDIAELNKTSVN